MKIALYIEDGLEQIVLTPDNETEAGILGKLHDGTRELTIKDGSFYDCRGGWTRWKERTRTTYSFTEERDESTIIVLRRKPETPEGERA